MISVQVIRRIDTRTPTPLLSTFITPTGLGKLADFRTVKANTQSSSSTSPSWRPTAAGPPATAKSWNTTTTTQSQGSSSNAPTQRGWSSVVTSGASTSSLVAVNTGTQSSVLVPKPTTTSSSSSSSEVLPVSHDSTLGGVGSNLSRTVSPAHFPSEPVPEDWEDDV